LNGFEHSGLERLGKARVQCSRFLTLTLYSLKVVKPTFSSDLALKLLQAIERHASRIRLIGLEYFACLFEIEDMPVGISLGGLEEGL